MGIMRVKNEARWIERSILSILPLCDRILVMDDHSDDATPFLCASLPNVDVFNSPFSDLNETRDKNYLLDRARHADWVICIDGDEMLAPQGIPVLQRALQSQAPSISMRIPYLWDSEDQIRVDRVYGEFRRHSAFRPYHHRFTSSTAGGFHCGNAPSSTYLGVRGVLTLDHAPLLHFGYLHAKDRARKYAWYNAMDPGNPVEDRYRHIAAGLDVPHEDLVALQRLMRKQSGKPDLRPEEVLPPAPKATEKTAHAGPVELVGLRELMVA
jgi:glycosyltransferase involved in cell wall biosynthesis